MTTTYLKNKINKRINSLSKEKLLVVDDFVSYLSQKEGDKKAADILEISGLLNEIDEAKKEFKNGKGVDWHKVRKDV